MDAAVMPGRTGFRFEVREWLEANYPAELRTPPQGESDICWGGKKWAFQSDAQRVWLERMAGKGWTVPTWPKAYGGGGLSHEENAILRDEMQRMGARSPLDSFGISMLGPALLKFGTESQKREHLPPIARGEIRWCQGYSEPNAGSDLASLQTRAEDAGDHFLVSGQKIWTSYADKADWMFCLVRTDPSASKHRGISFVLFDMASPGVTTRPIELISGKSPFCETFLDGVVVHKSNLVGELNKGWDIAKYLLTHERQMIGSGGTAKGILSHKSLAEIACDFAGLDTQGRLDNPMLRGEIAQIEIDALCSDLLTARVKDEASQGVDIGARSASLKYVGTEVKKRQLELLVSAVGYEALVLYGDDSLSSFAREWLRSKATSIEGGTSEIMLNIIAKNILRLPGE